MDSSDTGSSDKGFSADHKAGDTSGSAIDKAKATEGAEAAPSAAAHSETGADAAQGAAGAKPRPGSSLILVPPVTRKTEGSQSIPPHAASDAAASAAAFTTDRGPRRRFLKQGWPRYAAPAALGLCLFGVGVATGGQFFGTTVPANSAAPVAVGGPKGVQAAIDQTEMRRLTKKLGDEIHALQARVEALRVAAQTATPEDVRGLKKGLDGLRASLDAAKAETSASIAQLSVKVDRLQREQAKLQQPIDKASHGEHSAGAPATTASIPHAAAPHGAAVETALVGPALPKGQAQPLAPAAEPKKKLQLLVDWVVRDVYQGVALVDGPEGSIEVARGDSIPGAGTVESIERKNGGWIIITSRGIVGSVGD
ncbi:MAG: hypothetical protein WCF20_00110 [Methylovirgula sp.]